MVRDKVREKDKVRVLFAIVKEFWFYVKGYEFWL